MKRKLISLCLVYSFLSTSAVYANWFQDIINAINAQGMISNGFLSNINTQQTQLLSSQREIERLMSQVNQNLKGHSGWGNFNFRDNQSYGGSASNWAYVLQMADQGQGDGALGQTIGHLSNQFPTERNSYNRGVSNLNSQKYYALKSQTVLATRAASQLDYNKIQDQILYQQMLQQQIEKTNDLKAAIDLTNRIQVEGNLINLEILRLIALANQQQAVSEQATLNSALTNAKFLTK